jgi:hypothetical protein
LGPCGTRRVGGWPSRPANTPELPSDLAEGYLPGSKLLRKFRSDQDFIPALCQKVDRVTLAARLLATPAAICIEVLNPPNPGSRQFFEYAANLFRDSFPAHFFRPPWDKVRDAVFTWASAFLGRPPRLAHALKVAWSYFLALALPPMLVNRL